MVRFSRFAASAAAALCAATVLYVGFMVLALDAANSGADPRAVIGIIAASCFVASGFAALAVAALESGLDYRAPRHARRAGR